MTHGSREETGVRSPDCGGGDLVRTSRDAKGPGEKIHDGAGTGSGNENRDERKRIEGRKSSTGIEGSAALAVIARARANIACVDIFRVTSDDGTLRLSFFSWILARFENSPICPSIHSRT